MTTSPVSPITRTVSLVDDLTLRFEERANNGRPMLILHGGGGPQTVASIAAEFDKAHTLLPIHPGFSGTSRPEWFNSIEDLAFAYLDLLDRLELRDVLVVGNSVGGWIASVMGLLDTAHRLRGLVIINGTGIQVEGHPVADVSSLTPQELAVLSFHNPAALRVDPATVTPEQIEGRAANARALAIYNQGLNGSDPKLGRHLRRVRIPVLVAWGESDQVVDTEYGRAYARAFLNARFEPIAEAGHLPQIEQPQRLFTIIRNFAINV